MRNQCGMSPFPDPEYESMNLTIKPLSPDLAADFLDFFDNRAFTDNSPMQPCYCCRPQMTAEQEEVELLSMIRANKGTMPRDIPGFKLALRGIAEKQIQSGSMRGYLAFTGGVSIGWCNANDKANYTDLAFGECVRGTFDTTIRERAKSVLCFEIAPEYRGKGIATALLSRICEDATIEGFDVVEGYPHLHDHREAYDFTGPVRLFEKAGFVKVVELGQVAVMRKRLR